MLEILRYDAPWLWGYHPKDYGLYHSWHKNVKLNKISNNHLKYFRIDANLRDQLRRKWNEPVLWPIALLFLVLIGGIISGLNAFRHRETSTGINVY